MNQSFNYLYAFFCRNICIYVRYIHVINTCLPDMIEDKFETKQSFYIDR